MSGVTGSDIPKAKYGLWMAVVTVLALASVWALTRSFGGDSPSALTAIKALAIASFATFIPAVLNIGRAHWGLAVLVSGMGRALLAVGLAFGFAQQNDALSSGALMKAVSGVAILILVVESFLAIQILRQPTAATTDSTHA